MRRETNRRYRPLNEFAMVVPFEHGHGKRPFAGTVEHGRATIGEMNVRRRR